jgi:hypothetical protein
MTKLHAGKFTKKKSAWEAQARSAAAGLGVSEAKVKKKVEAELIRIVAEEIAKKEIVRLQNQHGGSGEATARPLNEIEEAIRRTGSWFPGDDR